MKSGQTENCFNPSAAGGESAGGGQFHLGVFGICYRTLDFSIRAQVTIPGLRAAIGQGSGKIEVVSTKGSLQSAIMTIGETPLDTVVPTQGSNGKGAAEFSSAAGGGPGPGA